MALGNLADLEELEPTPGRPDPLTLYHEVGGAAMGQGRYGAGPLWGICMGQGRYGGCCYGVVLLWGSAAMGWVL